jgi:hypothetical protein
MCGEMKTCGCEFGQVKIIRGRGDELITLHILFYIFLLSILLFTTFAVRVRFVLKRRSTCYSLLRTDPFTIYLNRVKNRQKGVVQSS